LPWYIWPILFRWNLKGYPEGSNKVPIDVVVANKVEIEDISPKQVLFKFESIISKEKPVVLRTVGDMEDGFSVGKESINPISVIIRGPRSLVNSVLEVVATVDTTNLRSDLSTSIPIKAVDDDGKEVRGVEKEPKTVDILLPILRTKNVNIEPQFTGAPLNGFKITGITSNPSTINIKGYEDDIADIQSLKTIPIDINYATKDVESEVQFELPPGVELVSDKIKPIATIKIEEIIEATFEYKIDEILKTNLKSDLIVDKIQGTETIVIKVSGASSLIKKLTKTDLSPYVNLQDLAEGTHSVVVNILKTQDIDNQLTINEITPNTIDLTLKNGQ